MEDQVSKAILLLLVAVLVGIGAQRIRLPYTLALTLSGIGIGLFHIKALAGLHLSKNLLLSIFLPALLFEAAYHVDMAKFRKDMVPILLLAIPGVLIAVGVTASVFFGISLVAGTTLSWTDALLFAAMLAATDPISVLALFKTFGVDKRLYLIVEGESLLNDGVAVVILVILAAILNVPMGHDATVELHGFLEIAGFTARTFIWMAGVGTLLGAILGAGASFLTRQIDDKLVETALSFVLAYGSFQLAESLHASGVIATVVAGVVLGNFGSSYGMSAITRVAIEDFWEMLAFIANSFVFLLVGVELDLPELGQQTGLIGAGFLAVLFGRIVSVYVLVPLSNRLGRPLPRAWSHVLVWGGLRGSLSMVLVMGLPADYPGRRTLLLVVFGVVALSLFVQGLTMRSLLTALKLIGHHNDMPYEQARTRARMAEEALVTLQNMKGHLSAGLLKTLTQYYETQKQQATVQASDLAGPDLQKEQFQEAMLHLIVAEEEALRAALHESAISQEASECLFIELALRREAIREAIDIGELQKIGVAAQIEETPQDPTGPDV